MINKKSVANPYVLLELIDNARRSWWTVIAGLSLGLAIGLIMLDRTPKVYEATTKIFAAAERISRDYVRTTISDDTELRLGALREEVLSRKYLMSLIDEAFEMPATAQELDSLMESIRRRVYVYYFPRARYFELRYQDTDPDRAAQVVNTLANLYIAENARFRISRADDATQTLEELAGASLAELQSREQEIAKFKSQHLHRLPENQAANLQLLGGRRGDLESNQKDQHAAQDQLRLLQAQKSQSGRLDAMNPGSVTPDSPEASLRALEAELKGLLSRLTDSHPDVERKRREIADLKATMTAEGGDGESEEAIPTVMDAQIEAVRRRITLLGSEEQRLKNEIREIEQRIDVAPRIAQQLADLEKGLDVLRQQYQDDKRKVESAKNAKRIEEAQQGNQFEVIETAVPPSIPISPKPLLILGAWAIGGLVFFVTPVVLHRLLSPLVWSANGLQVMCDTPVLVSIPSIDTPEVRRKSRRNVLKNLTLSAASVAVLAVAVAFVLQGG